MTGVNVHSPFPNRLDTLLSSLVYSALLSSLGHSDHLPSSCWISLSWCLPDCCTWLDVLLLLLYTVQCLIFVCWLAGLLTWTQWNWQQQCEHARNTQYRKMLLWTPAPLFIGKLACPSELTVGNVGNQWKAISIEITWAIISTKWAV